MKSKIKRSVMSGLAVVTTIGIWSVIYSVLAFAWIRTERKAQRVYNEESNHSDAA